MKEMHIISQIFFQALVSCMYAHRRSINCVYAILECQLYYLSWYTRAEVFLWIILSSLRNGRTRDRIVSVYLTLSIPTIIECESAVEVVEDAFPLRSWQVSRSRSERSQRQLTNTPPPSMMGDKGSGRCTSSLSPSTLVSGLALLLPSS